MLLVNRTNYCQLTGSVTRHNTTGMGGGRTEFIQLKHWLDLTSTGENFSAMLYQGYADHNALVQKVNKLTNPLSFHKTLSKSMNSLLKKIHDSKFELIIYIYVYVYIYICICIYIYIYGPICSLSFL